MAFLIVGVIIFILVIACVAKYNKMIRYRNKVKESLRLIDIHLQLRFDLIPNLVETVKGYSKHEYSIFSELINARKSALKETDEKKKIEYANEMLPNMRRVIAIAEEYPELKSDVLYKDLMEELVAIEDKLAASRRFYDSNVSEYNTLITVFPNSVIANLFNFKECELFKIDVGENFSMKFNKE